MRRIVLQCLLMLCCCGSLALGATRAAATTYTVTDLRDSSTVNGCTAEGTGDGCTLREAVTDSNAAGGTNSIVFASGLTGSVSLANPLPDLSANVTITGNGASKINITRSTTTGTADFVIFVVNSGVTAKLDALTVSNGAYDLDTQNGGGIENEGALTVNNCVITGNAGLYGGGIISYLGSTLSMDNTTLSNNTAENDGGGFISNGTVTMTNCLITGNDATYGGGMEVTGPATLSNSTVSSNTADYGGGAVVYNSVSDTINPSLTVVFSTFSGNSASVLGGGVANYPDATLTVGSSTFSANTSATAGSGGGGIINAGTCNLTNSTFSGNTSPYGGAVQNDAGTLSLNFCTLANNTGSKSGGGIFNFNDDGTATATLTNTIVANNSTDVTGGGTYTSGGYNVIGNATGNITTTFTGTGDQTGITSAQINLGALQNNGGSTQTLALLATSVAIDKGTTSTTGLPSYDQRGSGYPRVQNGRPDVGAFEYSGVATYALKGTVYNAVALAKLSDVRVQAATDSGVVATTTTGSDGTFALQLPAGSYTLTATKVSQPKFRIGPSFTNPVTITSAGTGSTNYVFRAIGIGGRIISPSNVGISGLTVNLFQGSYSLVVATTTTDSNGFFSFDGLLADTWQVIPATSDTYTFTPTSQTVTVADAAVFISFKAAVSTVYSISGNVTIVNNSGTSQALSGVTVTVTRASDSKTFTYTTTSTGAYTIAGLTAGTYSVTAAGSGYVYAYVPSPAQTQPFALTSSAPKRTGINFIARPYVKGRVLNAVALAGLSGITVKGVRTSDSATFTATTDSTGNYVLPVDAGTYTLSAYLPAAPTTYPIAATFTNPVSVTTTISSTSYIFRAVGIGGRVVTATNVGISGVTLKLYAKSDTSLKKVLRTVTTDSNGFFSFDGIVAGNWNVVPTQMSTYTFTPTSQIVTISNAAVFISFRATAATTKSLSSKRSALLLSVASADAQTGTITLKFTGALDADSVADLAHYAVSVNGTAVDVVAATLSGGGDTIVLTLPEGALSSGSHVIVDWAGVLDTLGLPLQGETQLTAG